MIVIEMLFLIGKELLCRHLKEQSAGKDLGL